jgi:glyoxylase-like metal-dependent hydrolase (beta-lactamase superfamily II)
MNVFFIREGDSVACFDSGSREMAGELRRLAARMGGVSRVVLSHAHPDHRGGARGIGAPVWCHPDEQRDVEGDAGRHYWARGVGSSRKLDLVRGLVMGTLRDAGAVSVAGTLREGDSVGPFEVLHLPGHAPGQIALWREADRTILVSDCFYTLDENTAALPKPAFNHDPDLALASVRRIAALEPSLAWPGHGPALSGDVRGTLERALGVA